jgi:hypothetical protein
MIKGNDSIFIAAKIHFEMSGHLYSNDEVIDFVRRKFVDNFCLPVGRNPDAASITGDIDILNEMVGRLEFF